MIEFILLGLIGFGIYWAWNQYKMGRWDMDNPRPGEQWNVVDTKDCTGGFAYLTDARGRWGIKVVPDDERAKTKTSWYASEHEARRAFEAIR